MLRLLQLLPTGIMPTFLTEALASGGRQPYDSGQSHVPQPGFLQGGSSALFSKDGTVRRVLRDSLHSFASRIHSDPQDSVLQRGNGKTDGNSVGREQPRTTAGNGGHSTIAATISEEDVRAGREVMRQLYGEEYSGVVSARLEELNLQFARLAEGVAYARFWSDGVLSVREKSLLTIASLIAQGKEEQTKIHMRGFLESGGSIEELEAALLHLVVYCGFPSVMNAFKQLNAAREDAHTETKASTTDRQR